MTSNISKLEYRMNSQESVTNQLQRLKIIANQHGLYDASDWIEQHLCDERTRQHSEAFENWGGEMPEDWGDR